MVCIFLQTRTATAMTALTDTDFIWGAWRARQNAGTASPNGFARRLALALELEVNWIDHADIYDDGAVETLHGDACARLSHQDRDRLRIITKCGVRFPSAGQPGVRAHHYRSDAQYLRQQAEASLSRLRTDRLDLYLLHRPDYLMQADETARALEDLVTQGKIAAFGVSNFSTAQLDRLQSATVAPLAAHQIELSPLASAPLDDGRLDQARQRDMPLLIWSPLAGGQLFTDTPAAATLRAALKHGAETSGCTDIAAAALAWLKRLPGTIIPILGTMNETRLHDQITQARRIEMDAQTWYEILEAGRGQRVP